MTSRRQFLGTTLAALPVFAVSSLANETNGDGTFPGTPAADRGDELCLMTYNLRYGSNTPPNDWPSRRPLVKTLLDKYQPDLIGTQEGLYRQVKDIDVDLPDYQWIGLGRDGGSRGEFMAIYYRTDRFEPLEFDHFWLSDTPDIIGSSTWGNTNRRMVTWARFQDRRTNKEFYYWNTHLDHALQPAREKASLLIQERLKDIRPDLPLFLVGDFNAQAKANPIYDILTDQSGLQDTWFTASKRINEEANSFSGFGELRHEGRRIDWVLSRGNMDVRASEVVTLKPTGHWPSDHCPVVSWLTLK